MKTIFDPITGQIFSTIISDDIIENSVDGNYYDSTHYIDVETKLPIVKLSQPSANHEWNWETKSWQLNQSRLISEIRDQRNNLLLSVDRVNPIWYSTLTADQQQELRTYRQQLLDVPQQSGFPILIVWPTKPTWLK